MTQPTRPVSYQAHQCSDPACRFRFPALPHELTDGRCPLCSQPTRAVAVYSAYGAAEKSPPPPVRLCALLDNLRSAWNVGSILRTADGAGVRHLHLCGTTPTPDHPKVAKTSLGAERHVAWMYHRNALDAASALQGEGVQLWALESTPDSQGLYEAVAALLEGNDSPNIGLVVGNERAGVDPALLARCDRVVALPMRGSKASLNVSVAFGAAVYILG